MGGSQKPDDKQKTPKVLDGWLTLGASLLNPNRPAPGNGH